MPPRREDAESVQKDLVKPNADMFYYYHLWLSSLSAFSKILFQVLALLKFLEGRDIFYCGSPKWPGLHSISSWGTITSTNYHECVSTCASMSVHTRVAVPGLPDPVQPLEDRGWMVPWGPDHRISVQSLTLKSLDQYALN